MTTHYRLTKRGQRLVDGLTWLSLWAVTAGIGIIGGFIIAAWLGLYLN